MRNWLDTLKTSAALDATRSTPGGQPPASPRPVGKPGPAWSILALDRELRQPLPPTPAPADLRARILDAVRQSPAEAPSVGIWRAAWLVPTAGVACLALILCLPRFHSRPAPIAAAQLPPPPAGEVAVLDLAAATSADKLVAPLSSEFENFGRDLDRMREFLLATIP